MRSELRDFSLTIFIFCVFQFVNCFNTCREEGTCDEHLYSEDYLHDVYYSGLRRVTRKATTLECKRKIEFDYMRYVQAIAGEYPFPFEDILYYTQCKRVEFKHQNPVTKKHVRLRNNDSSYPPRRNESTLDANTLSILYVLIVHNNPQFTIHIINAIDEPQHSFVIHVDTAPSSSATYNHLLSKLSARKNIWVMTEHRERITWGAFSIVNATLNAMRLAWNKNITFDYFLLASGSSYPIKSNRFIRESLAKDPNTVFMDVTPEPSKPDPHLWHHFVECDGFLHRIARMAYIKGINMFIASQWFAAPRHIVQWFIQSSLAREYIDYAKHIIIADENYFSTMIMNSPYCTDERKRNLVFLLFDRWENEKAANNNTSANNSNNSNTVISNVRDERKCLNPDFNNCGRSPSILTMEYKHLISSSRALFARKIDPTNHRSLELVNFIDEKRGSISYYNGTVIDRSREKNVTASVESWDSNKDDGGKITMIRVGLSKEMLMVMNEEAELAATKASATANNSSTIEIASGIIEPSYSNISSATSTYNGSIASLSISSKGVSSNKNIGPHSTQPSSMLGAVKGMCLKFDEETEQIVSSKCNPLDSNQWFKIGHHFARRCTSGYELELDDFSCPLFKRTDADSEISTATSEPPVQAGASATLSQSESTSPWLSPEESSHVSCSILVGDFDKDACVDITGELAAADVPLIGYSCTGRWNQLFYLADNCTISAVQPSFVGRVRGMEKDEDLRLCLSVDSIGNLITSSCPPKENNESEGHSDGRMYSAQQFQYLPLYGRSFRLMMD